MFSILAADFAFQIKLFWTDFRRMGGYTIYLLIVIYFRLVAKLTAVAHRDFSYEFIILIFDYIVN